MKFSLALLVIGMGAQAQAQNQSIRANITGGDGDGKCTFEVEVDGVAEVEIRGDRGTIRQISGQRAVWRRLTCNQAFPSNPGNFRFKGVDGRGEQQLVRDPNTSGGLAVIRIQDPKGGSDGYTGDLEWRGGSDFFGGNGNWDTGRNPNGNWNNAVSSNEAMRICKNHVVETRNLRANQVTVRRGTSQEQTNNGDSIINFSFRNGRGVTKNGFCNVSSTGQLVQYQMEGQGNGNRTSWNEALNICQEEAGRQLGVTPSDVRVQHGMDPGNGSYLVNYQVQDRTQRIRTGACRVSAMGEIENFWRQ